MAFTINAVGNALTPFDSFLLLRGIKTLAVRMDRQQSSAMLVAQMLSKLGFVTHYPGLLNHPNKEVHDRIADGIYDYLITCKYQAHRVLLSHQVLVPCCLLKRGIRNLVSELLAPRACGVSVSVLVVSIA